MELEVTWKRALRVWWALFWRTLVCGLGADLILVIIAISIIALVFGVQDLKESFNDLKPVFKIVGYILNTLLGIYITKIVLKKDFKEFSIAIIAKGETEKLEVTNKITLKIWWACFWRSLVYSLVILGTLGVIAAILVPLSKTYSFLKIIFIIICIFYIAVFLLVAPYIIKIVLKKDFKIFRIALLANENLTENKINA